MIVAEPRYLLLLVVLLPAVVLLGRRSLAGLGRAQARVVLGLRLAAVTALVVALAEPAWRGLTPRVDVVFAVDHSRSIPAEQAEQIREAVNGSTARTGPLWEGGKVVVFAEDAVTEASLDRSEPITRYASAVDRDGSNLERGLQRALEAIEPDARGRVVLFSDGNETRGDVRSAVARARAAGVPVDVVPVRYRHEREVLVEKLVVPSRAQVGEPVGVRVVVRATAGARATLRLTSDGAVVESRRLELEPGTSVEELQFRPDAPGFFRLEAVLEPLRPEQSDHYPQNNASHGFVYVGGASEVLWVCDAPAEAAHVLEALGAEDHRVRVVHPADLPVEAGELQGFDAVVLDDVPRDAFSSRQLESVAAAVADVGVGLVMVGGPRSFGAGGWADTPVEDALPVHMHPKGSEVVLSAAMVLVIDRSGSMSGEKIRLAKRAAGATADALSSRDRLGVVAFDSAAQWVARLSPAGRGSAILQRIAALDAEGGTDALPGLRLARRALLGAEANTKHVILLTDGQDLRGGCHGLARRLAAEGITVSTVGVGDGARSPDLKRVAHAGRGRFYGVAEAADLPRIFVKETRRVARSLIVSGRFEPRPRGASPVLGALDGFPPLEGYVLTEPKARAQVALATPDGAPVLAHWQFGLGKALAFTSDARPRWAPGWVAWPGFQAFWSQALRWVSRSLEDERFQVTARADGAVGRLLLDAVDARGELVDGLSVRARVRPPTRGGEPLDVALRQRGPGRYEAEVPLREAGTHEVALVCEDARGEVRHAVTTGLVAPLAPEFRDLESDAPLLEEVARATGGRVLTPWDLAEGRVDPWDPHDLPERDARVEGWPLCLVLAVVLFLLDVAVRRVAIDWGRLGAHLAPGAGEPGPTEPGRTTSHLRDRLAQVREAGPAAAPPTLAPGAVADASSAGGSAAPVVPPPPTEREPQRADDPADADAEEPSTFTSRLLAAKRRAKRVADGDDPRRPGGGDDDPGPAAR